jgi:hypothetical protein
MKNSQFFVIKDKEVISSRYFVDLAKIFQILTDFIPLEEIESIENVK